MMKKILHKLRSKAGESLIESLAAILIFTMASIIMYSMITTSADINLIAKDKDAAVYDQLVIAEQAKDDSTEGDVMMTITTATSGATKTVYVGKVDIYGEPGNTLYAYYEKE